MDKQDERIGKIFIYTSHGEKCLCLVSRITELKEGEIYLIEQNGVHIPARICRPATLDELKELII